MSESPYKLLDGITAEATGNAVRVRAAYRTFQAKVAGSGAVSATVKIEVSNDKETWLEQASIALSGTTSASDGAALPASWVWVRGRVSAISGTGATVNLWMGTSQ